MFSVQWTAEMAFATIIGGLGTIEGPIIGTIVYLVLQQTLASYNAWYLIILGLVAILIALFARRGLWGLVDERLNVRLFPVGYWLRLAGEGRRGGAGSSPSRRARGDRGSPPRALADEAGRGGAVFSPSQPLTRHLQQTTCLRQRASWGLRGLGPPG